MRNWVNCWEPKAVVAMVISSQIKALNKALKGSETRDQAKAVTSPRAPNIQVNLDEDIVRHSLEMKRVEHKQLHVTDVKNTTFKMQHIRLWKHLPKMAAYNTVNCWNRFVSSVATLLKSTIILCGLTK